MQSRKQQEYSIHSTKTQPTNCRSSQCWVPSECLNILDTSISFLVGCVGPSNNSSFHVQLLEEWNPSSPSLDFTGSVPRISRHSHRIEKNCSLHRCVSCVRWISSELGDLAFSSELQRPRVLLKDCNEITSTTVRWPSLCLPLS